MAPGVRDGAPTAVGGQRGFAPPVLLWTTFPGLDELGAGLGVTPELLGRLRAYQERGRPAAHLATRRRTSSPTTLFEAKAKWRKPG